MLSVAAPDKFVLTLQSVPPFLVESLLAFAVAVLLAVPLVARIQHLFVSSGHSDNSQTKTTMGTSGRKSARNSRRIIVQYPPSNASASGSNQNHQQHSLRPINSFPNLRRSLETLTSGPEDEEELHNAENDETSNDNPIIDMSAYNYDLYRHKLIENNLKKQYGCRQAPGNVVLTCLHLSSFDSSTGIQFNEKYNHSLFDFEPDLGESINNKNTEIRPRDHFLTKEIDKTPMTSERATETVDSTIEIDPIPDMGDVKERRPTSGSSRRHRICKMRKEKLPTLEILKPKIDIVTTVKEPTKSHARLRTPRNIPRSKQLLKMTPQIEFNTHEVSNLMENPKISVDVKQSDLIQVKNAPETVVDDNSDVCPSHVTTVIEKCSSIATSNALSTCSTRIQPIRLQNSRPTSSCGTSRPYRNLMPRVNSRPRSSGGSFAWEVPNVSGNIWSYEQPLENRATTPNSRRPRSASTTISKKKSESVLSVLESIYDLVYDDSIEHQESVSIIDESQKTILDTKKLDEKEITKRCKDEKNDQSSFNKKSISREQMDGKKRTKSIVNEMSREHSTINEEKWPFLRSRSGKYATLNVTSLNKEKAQN